MNPVDSVKALRSLLLSTKDGVAGDTVFMAKASLLSVVMLDECRTLLRQLTRKGHNGKAPSSWQRFVAKGARAGKPLQQIAKEWKTTWKR